MDQCIDCERARSEYFFQKGLTPIINGAHFVVRKMDCDFIASALFSDEIIPLDLKPPIIADKPVNYPKMHTDVKPDGVA